MSDATIVLCLGVACLCASASCAAVAVWSGGGLGLGGSVGGGASIPKSAFVGRRVSDFQGIQEPPMVGKGGNDIKNIQDVGGGIIRFTLRVGPGGAWRDGDNNGTTGKLGDRQRAEVTYLGGKSTPHRIGETWEYGCTFRTDPNFRVYGHGWNDVMQIKPQDGGGNSGPPLASVNITSGHGPLLTADVACVLEDNAKPRVAKSFSFQAGQWVSCRIRLKIHATAGMLQASINGSPWQGLQNVPMLNKRFSVWTLKCGFYRKLYLPTMNGTTSYIEIKTPYRAKIA